MKYETVIDHWEVEVTTERFNNGEPLLKQTYSFTTDKDAIIFAKERDLLGQRPVVRVIEKICNWKNNA